MASSTDTVFGYMFTKYTYINLKFGMLYAQACFYNILYGLLKILKILDFGKSYIEIKVFHFLGSPKNCFWKIRDSRMKDLSILRLSVLLVSILLKIPIFSDFANIYPFSTKNCITLGCLNRYSSKSF